ncbi:hypothetical protein SCG7086_BE_00010 [Chlamydiales bacterium SCGC AG-110-P3]|nr:hypothetical protein SCG7086_BE_00010 [Chlamydiales bacterium SCGC AG-110-P3]
MDTRLSCSVAYSSNHYPEPLDRPLDSHESARLVTGLNSEDPTPQLDQDFQNWKRISIPERRQLIISQLSAGWAAGNLDTFAKPLQDITKFGNISKVNRETSYLAQRLKTINEDYEISLTHLVMNLPDEEFEEFRPEFWIRRGLKVSKKHNPKWNKYVAEIFSIAGCSRVSIRDHLPKQKQALEQTKDRLKQEVILRRFARETERFSTLRDLAERQLMDRELTALANCVAQKLLLEECKSTTTSTASRSSPTLPSTNIEEVRSLPIEPSQLRPVSKEVVASTSSQLDALTRIKLTIILAQAHQSGSIRQLSRVTRRWLGSTATQIGGFVDYENGQKIHRYKNLSHSERLIQKARHFLPGVETIFSRDQLKSVYAVPSESKSNSFIAFAKIIHANKSEEYGRIQFGFGQDGDNNLLIHRYFEPIVNEKSIAELFPNNLALESINETSTDDDGWVHPAARFAFSDIGEITIDYPNRDLNIGYKVIIIPVRRDLIHDAYLNGLTP